MVSLYTDCWLARLTDPVGSVREAAAIALIQCLPVLPSTLVSSLQEHLSTNLLKAKEPVPTWELSDGCLFLVRELASAHAPHQDLCLKYLSQLPDLGLVDHFPDAPLLRENLFKCAIEILKALGKKKFRAYVELYLDSAFRTAKGKLLLL